MTFERPWAWALLALALPIVLLHLHLMRRRLVEVSSLELWRDLVPDTAGRGGLRRLRDGVALACLLAALFAFTAAAAGPVTGTAASGPRRLAIVVDASASMARGEFVVPSRWSYAVDMAVSATRKLARQDEVLMWVATPKPHVGVEPMPPGRYDHTVDHFDWGPTLEPRAIATTTRLAIRAAPGVSNRPATVLVLTDAIGAESLQGLAAADVDLRVGVVDDHPAKNSGIVAFDLDPAESTRVVVRVATTDGPAQPRELFLMSGESGEKELSQTPLLFDAAGNATAVLPLRDVARTGGLVEARLVPGDDFPEDDTSLLMLPEHRPLAVAVVAEKPSPFLVEALRAMPDVVDPKRTTLVAPGSPASAVVGADVVIVDVENGGSEPGSVPSLWFGGGGARIDRPLLWGVGTHPILAGVDLSPLRIERASLVEPRPGETTIIASAQGAVGVAGGEGAARRVVFGFRPDASTLPLEAAFPLLVRNAIRWLGTPKPAPRYVVAGEPWPDGDGEPTGETVPYPPPGGPYIVRTKTGQTTVVRWVAPRGFRLSPATPVAAMSAAEAVASLPDRHLDTDTRERFASWCAAAGAAALVLGALLLRSGAQTPRDAPAVPVALASPPPPALASR